MYLTFGYSFQEITVFFSIKTFKNEILTKFKSLIPSIKEVIFFCKFSGTIDKIRSHQCKTDTFLDFFSESKTRRGVVRRSIDFDLLVHFDFTYVTNILC